MKNRVLLALFTVLFCGLAVMAQSSTKGTVNGKVVDDQGTPLPGVTVVFTNMEQGLKRSVVTDAKGKYRAPFLPLGTYSVEASLPGFARYNAKDLVLNLGDIITYNITLKPEKLTETIVVTAETPLIETGKVDVMSSVSNDYIENLPVANRDFKDFVLLTPGVTEASGNRVTDVGTRGIMNNLQIDGAGYNSTFFGEQRGSTRIPFTFSQETIKEFNVVTNGYSARYGDATGLIINAVTKSGSNEFHGSAHWFRQTDGMINSYRPARYQPKPLEDRRVDDFTKDQFGFTVSGPIIKDKLHFFLSYDAQRKDTSFVRRFRQRAGYEDFASTFPEIVAANEGDEPGTEDNDVYFLKLDWQINDANRLSFRVNRQEFEAKNGTSPHRYETNGITNNGLEQDFSTSIVAELSTIVADNMFNELRVQWSQEHRPRYANTTDQMEVVIGGYDAVFGQNNFLPNWLNELLVEVQDDFTWIVGDHTVRAGFRYANYDYDDGFFRYSGGRMRFYGGYEDFIHWMDDDPSNDPGRYDMKYLQAFSPINGAVKYGADEWDAYLEDEWQFNDQLLMTFGARATSQSFDNMVNPNPELQELGLEELPDETNVAPRFALTYDITGEGTDLIRFGAGYFYNRTPSLLAANAILANGVNVIRLTFRPGDPLFPTNLNDRIGPNELDPQNPYPSDVLVFSKDWENPRVFKTSLSYEKKLGDVWLAAVDLKYTRGYHFERKLDQNLGIKDADGDGVQDVDEYGRPLWDSRHRPNPDFNRIITFMSDAESKASSITFRLEKKFSDRWSMFASYTLSSSYDNDTNERSVSSSSNYPTNPANLMDDWGRSDYYNKSQFKFSWTVLLWYDIRFSGYHRFYSGRPYTVTSGHDDNGDDFYNDYAVIDGQLTRRNIYRQPNFAQTDISLSKTFRFLKRQSVEIIFQMFNVFNRANRYTTLTNYRYNSDHLGELDQVTLTPRQYQFGIRYRF